jgi:release factor glutamine methyltransferase
VSIALTGPPSLLATALGVYAPQDDSLLLIDTLERSTVVIGRTVADLCTGTGVVAIAAAELGAARVTAWDVCPLAADCAVSNAQAIGANVVVRRGSLAAAGAEGPYDVVVSNPPYVPTPPSGARQPVPLAAGPVRAGDGGEDGRLVLDPLCASAPRLLTDGGTLLFVQSEFAGVETSLAALRAGGLTADVVAWRLVPFGPVLWAQANWLESTGRLAAGHRVEELVVIRADKP